MSDFVELSASQKKLAKLCLARWGAKYLGGLEDPAGAAAEDGKVVHKELEDWAIHLIMPKHPKALKGLPHATAPGTANIERPISFTTARSRMRGFIDVQYVLWHGKKYTIELGSAGHHIVVQDWKTTSNMAYALTAEQLRADIQFNTYAYEAFVGLGAGTVSGKWVYLPPTGPAQLVEIVADRNEVIDFVEGPLDAAGHELQQLYKIRPKWTDLPKDTKGCFAYNKQCPFYEKCKPVQPSFDMSEGEPIMTDFRASIANDFPGAPGLPPLPGLPAVPPPPLPVAPPPPAPSRIESADAGGLSAAEIASLVAAEMAKRGVGPSHAPGVPDTSFVNPGEQKVPAANPEQAAAQQGITKPVPEAPVVDAATGWDRDQCNAYLMTIGATTKKNRSQLETLQGMVRDACKKLGIAVGAMPTEEQRVRAAEDTGAVMPILPPPAPPVSPDAPAVVPPPPAPPAAPQTPVAPIPSSRSHEPINFPVGPGAVDVERAAKDVAAGRKPKFTGFMLIDGNVMNDIYPANLHVIQLYEIVTAANKRLNVRDFGLIQYEGTARLCGAVEDLFASGELVADIVVFDGTTREGGLLYNTLMALAAHRG